MDAGLRELIRLLASPSADDAEEAKYLLIERGPAVVPELAASLTGLTGPGRVLAVEIFTALGDRRASPALVTLLDDDNSLATEWAAEALGNLGWSDAIPALSALKDRMVAARVSPDCTGPVRVRQALTDLGARIPVVPPLTSSLTIPGNGWTGWPSTVIADVVADLAASRQVVLYFTLWWVEADGHRYWTQHDSVKWAFDWDSAWDANVRAGREAALIDAAFIPDSPYLPSPGKMAAHIEWIDQSDIHTGRAVPASS